VISNTGRFLSMKAIIEEYQSPLDKLYHWERVCPDKIYLHQPINNSWKTWTWRQVGEESRRMAAYLVNLNFPLQSKIGLISRNCAHWIICDLAIMMSGHISVPLYPNLTAASINYILNHSDAVLLFVGKLDDWPTMKEGIPEAIKCITFPFYPNSDCMNWSDILLDHEPLKENKQRRSEEVGTIIYTSGTTGVPKGVVHQFKSFSFTTLNSIPYLGFHTNSRFFSYLPLSHSAERSLVEMGSLYSGGEIYFSESISSFPKNLAEAKPTEFLAVHHIWKKIQQRIVEGISQRKLDILLKLPLVSGWLKRKIKKTIGLQYANNIIAGASAMPVDLMEWFAAIGINIQEGYGLTENWSYSHINRKDNIKLGYVGQPFPGVECTVDKEGEILVRHKGLMKEYYKDKEKTANSFTGDGYLKTEDTGYIDKEGFLKITGRKKDIFKTSKGNYVTPSPIEMQLSGNENIDFACVVGNHLPQPMALIILSVIGKNKPKEVLTEEMKILFNKLNSKLNVYDRLSKFILINNKWDVEQGILTPTLKVKRKEVEKKYGSFFQQWQLQEDFMVISEV
jgi:long-chain acyl-CoA synthetase